MRLGCQGLSDSQRSSLARGRRMAMAVAAMLVVLAAGSASSARPSASQSTPFPPEIVGEERVGAEDVCGSGSWTESPTFEYEFVREGIVISARAPYPGNVHFCSKADEGHQLWCIVTAKNGSGSTRQKAGTASARPKRLRGSPRRTRLSRKSRGAGGGQSSDVLAGNMD